MPEWHELKARGKDLSAFYISLQNLLFDAAFVQMKGFPVLEAGTGASTDIYAPSGGQKLR